MAEKAEPSKKPRPNIRQRRVAKKLREWRNRTGRTQEAVATQLHWSQPKLNRFENATTIAGPAEVIALAAVLGVSEEERDVVLTYAQAGQEGLVWWRAYANTDGDFADFIETEAEATLVRNVQTLLIPGLLQTDAVAELLARAWQGEAETDEAVIERRRAIRQRRQARLTDQDNPLQLHAIIHEAALQEPLGGVEIKEPQLDHLLDMSKRSNVTIQVIEVDHDVYPGFGASYHLVHFDQGEAAAVYMDNLTSGLYVEAEEDVEAYTLNFERLRKHHALDPETSAQRIAEIRGELT